ncbi:MAG: glycosyltransferase [Bacteroidales bacterium]|jgi:glycosyltransferase involved in cell wall biosynthesis|nr:glycosyltransferase [Bacteroidales bacterium]
MKVLQLCNKPPYPPVDGGTIAMNSITQGLLGEKCLVRVLSVCSDKHPVNKALLTEDYIEKTRFESVYIDLNIKILDALLSLFLGESYNVKRYESKDFSMKLVSILKAEEFDIIHVESIFLTPYLPLIRRYSNAKVVLRAHNVEHLIWKRVAKCTKNIFKRWYIKKLYLALRLYELEHIGKYDGIACITHKDVDYFKSNGCKRPIESIPFGIIAPDIMDNVDEEPNSLFHIGSMDWIPNLEAVDWFLNEVWNKVHAELPMARLYLAGRKMPQHLMKMDCPNVSVIGEVPDAMYFIESKKINIVPLLSGSGIRVKIIEAMSVGKTVISTTVGAEGIDYTDGVDILIADTPEDFVRQIKRCLEDDDFCTTIGRNAFNLVATHYNNELLTKKLLSFYDALLDRDE